MVDRLRTLNADFLREEIERPRAALNDIRTTFGDGAGEHARARANDALNGGKPWRETVRDIYDRLLKSGAPSDLESYIMEIIEARHSGYFSAVVGGRKVKPEEIATWCEGVNAAATKARDMARRMRGYVANDPYDAYGNAHILTLETLSHAAVLEQFADSLAEMAMRGGTIAHGTLVAPAKAEG
jgi:hypothetical protein